MQFSRYLTGVVFALGSIAMVACGDEGLSTEATNAKPVLDAGGDWGLEASSSDASDAQQEVMPKECEPKTCAQVGATCGSAPDGCDGIIECGECPEGQSCGGGGENLCGTELCIPKSCLQVEAQCGWASDGCSKAMDCGGCAFPQTCGGGGEPNTCGCTPKSCSQLGANCGTLPDGCDGIISCGTCSGGQTCGGSGPNLCGTSECIIKTCSQLGASCGLASDGCSDVLYCGDCLAPNVCGGGGVVNQCGCTPKTCSQLGASCGIIDTGCGDTDCGSCESPETCEGGGVDNQCGCTCSLPNATTQCSLGVCSIVACDAGWEDCDGNPDNGCEANLATNTSHCGACGATCSFANASASCEGGKCKLGSCKTGYANCDGNATNGCEANLATSSSNCGACGRSCPNQCIDGTCEFTSADTSRKWDQTYRGSGEQRTDAPSYNHQGYYSSINGIQKSAIGAPDKMVTDLAGATVLDIWVYLHSPHWYYYAGGTARIGVHGNSTKPSTFPGINQDYAVNFERGEGKWVRLPTSWYASFKSGVYRGITLHAGNSSSSQYYGYMTASATKWRWKYRK